jgi:CheY-like chemotaxis protein
MMTKKRSAITELNVLIVEDNQFTALTLRKTLESLGLSRRWRRNPIPNPHPT